MNVTWQVTFFFSFGTNGFHSDHSLHSGGSVLMNLNSEGTFT